MNPLRLDEVSGFNARMSRTRRIASLWLPVLGWMILIFIASADVESGYRGSRILGPIIRWFAPEISPEALRQTVLFARKLVHFVTFAVLAALLYRALASEHPHASSLRLAGVVWGLTVLYAISDEVHQSFVPPRVGSPWDVAIDSIGAAFAVFAIRGWWRRRSKE